MQAILCTCPVCRSHVECPLRVGWRVHSDMGTIIIVAWYHIDEEDNVESVCVRTYWRPPSVWTRW